ncbi:GCN5-related N-acetyltransferase [Actinobacteria bacterium OK074]|nr:GCN5-related N-acetyltransferase [Actinobacteria bacterium OK074]
MDIVIREALAGEFGELGEITAQAYLRDGLLTFGEDDWYLGELRDVAKRAAAADVLVAVRGGQVLGGVTFVPSGGPMADVARPGEAEIRMLAVAQTARGQGAGEALVRACVDRARAADGCTGIVLSTQAMMRAAHRIYERLGFVRAPERDWKPLPDHDDLLLLTYELALRHAPPGPPLRPLHSHRDTTSGGASATGH